jgi:hypothetical protein
MSVLPSRTAPLGRDAAQLREQLEVLADRFVDTQGTPFVTALRATWARWKQRSA